MQGPGLNQAGGIPSSLGRTVRRPMPCTLRPRRSTRMEAASRLVARRFVQPKVLLQNNGCIQGFGPCALPASRCAPTRPRMPLRVVVSFLLTDIVGWFVAALEPVPATPCQLCFALPSAPPSRLGRRAEWLLRQGTIGCKAMQRLGGRQKHRRPVIFLRILSRQITPPSHPLASPHPGSVLFNGGVLLGGPGAMVRPCSTEPHELGGTSTHGELALGSIALDQGPVVQFITEL